MIKKYNDQKLCGFKLYQDSFGQHSFVFWTFLCELADLNTKKMDIGDVEVLDKETKDTER